MGHLIPVGSGFADHQRVESVPIVKGFTDQPQEPPAEEPEKEKEE